MYCVWQRKVQLVEEIFKESIKVDKECYKCGMVKIIPPNHLECLVDGHCVKVFDLDVGSAMDKLYDDCGKTRLVKLDVLGGDY